MHVFSFSSRKGTAASGMQPHVEQEVIKKRAEILRNMDAELGLQFRQQFIGQTAAVLIENDKGRCSGRSERYFMVHLDKTAEKLKKNDLVPVKIVKNNKTGAIGRVHDKDIR